MGKWGEISQYKYERTWHLKAVRKHLISVKTSDGHILCDSFPPDCNIHLMILNVSFKVECKHPIHMYLFASREKFISKGIGDGGCLEYPYAEDLFLLFLQSSSSRISYLLSNDSQAFKY